MVGYSIETETKASKQLIWHLFNNVSYYNKKVLRIDKYDRVFKNWKLEIRKFNRIINNMFTDFPKFESIKTFKIYYLHRINIIVLPAIIKDELYKILDLFVDLK